MILYDVIKRQVNALHMLEGAAGLPMDIKIEHRILWLGDQGSCSDPDGNELFVAQIRQNKTELGWLYQNYSMVLFKYQDVIHECSMTKLKDLIEDLLKEKKMSNNPEENVLIKNSLTNEINGFVWMEDVLQISNAIK